MGDAIRGGVVAVKVGGRALHHGASEDDDLGEGMASCFVGTTDRSLCGDDWCVALRFDRDATMRPWLNACTVASLLLTVARQHPQIPRIEKCFPAGAYCSCEEDLALLLLMGQSMLSYLSG
ncbi:hypothetical protein SESBI_01451 [Sesbania bispinosa]|nr:hypothetical protein SESBI_01451 [Sesbania bispinosa]